MGLWIISTENHRFKTLASLTKHSNFFFENKVVLILRSKLLLSPYFIIFLSGVAIYPFSFFASSIFHHLVEWNNERICFCFSHLNIKHSSILIEFTTLNFCYLTVGCCVFCCSVISRYFFCNLKTAYLYGTCTSASGLYLQQLIICQPESDSGLLSAK